MMTPSKSQTRLSDGSPFAMPSHLASMSSHSMLPALKITPEVRQSKLIPTPGALAKPHPSPPPPLPPEPPEPPWSSSQMPALTSCSKTVPPFQLHVKLSDGSLLPMIWHLLSR